MSPGPGTPAGRADAPESKSGQMFKSCWSCRLISGSGLIVAGAYVYHAAWKAMRLCGHSTIGTVAQMTFAVSLAAWGAVIITDPVGKAARQM